MSIEVKCNKNNEPCHSCECCFKFEELLLTISNNYIEKPKPNKIKKINEFNIKNSQKLQNIIDEINNMEFPQTSSINQKFNLIQDLKLFKNYFEYKEKGTHITIIGSKKKNEKADDKK